MRFKLRPFIPVLILLTLLPSLAYLQYRWQGQVSEALRSQLQEQMRRAAGQFSEDFDREIGRVYEDFQVNLPNAVRGEAGTDELRRTYRKLYSRWLQGAPHPNLVSDVYLITELKDTSPSTEHLRADNQFESIPFPEDLRQVFLLSTVKRGLSVSVVRMNGGTGKVVQLAPAIDRSVPAIAISIADSKLPSQADGTAEFRPASQPIAEVIIKLSLNVIRNELLPALAKKYLLNSDGTSTYGFAIVDRAGKHVVAADRPEIDPNTTGDISVPIFASNLLEFPKSFVAAVSERHSDDTDARSERRSRLAFIQQSSERFIASGVDIEAAPWQLVLTHQAGSLDAAVERARIKNLAIGFGILMLLGVSMGLTLLSVQRERKLAERQMEFVSAVSHELRTPLAVICSAGENLADGVVQDPNHTKEYGALVRNEGRRLAELVEQVLDFAGIQSGRKAYRFESVQVRDIIDQALDMFEIQIRENGMAVEKRVPLRMPTVTGDRAALIRALQNLIANALKYGSSGNWLSVRAEWKPPFVTIVVEDRGPGISSEDLSHVFEPFYRARTVVDAQIKGTGLGLSLVKQILDAHGAAVIVESIPKKHTSFTISIPVVTEKSDVVLSQPQDGETYSSR